MIINNKEIKLKVTLRAQFIYEEITGKAFEIKNSFEQYLYFYCLVLANNPDVNMTFENFLDYLDENPEAISELNKVMEVYAAKMKMFPKNEDEDEIKKK